VRFVRLEVHLPETYRRKQAATTAAQVPAGIERQWVNLRLAWLRAATARKRDSTSLTNRTPLDGSDSSFLSMFPPVSSFSGRHLTTQGLELGTGAPGAEMTHFPFFTKGISFTACFFPGAHWAHTT
jgi:hypothetical protein